MANLNRMEPANVANTLGGTQPERLQFPFAGQLNIEADYDLDSALFDCKFSPNFDEHLYDTIPHEDEIDWDNAQSRKTRKNLNAKKRKKSKEEVAILEAHFVQDPEWTRKTVKALKPLLNLTVDQIYKWGYDRKLLVEKRKSNAQQKRVRKSKTMKKMTKASNSLAVDDRDNTRQDWGCSLQKSQEFNSFKMQSHQEEQLCLNADLKSDKPFDEGEGCMEILSDCCVGNNFIRNDSGIFNFEHPSNKDDLFCHDDSDFYTELHLQD